MTSGYRYVGNVQRQWACDRISTLRGSPIFVIGPDEAGETKRY